jgi:hypothetical protein
MESNGTSLSSLAERLRARTEKDAREIESLTRKRFDSLSRSLAEYSQNALSATENAIRNSMFGLEKEIASRCRIMSLTFGKRCLQAATLTFIILLAAGLSGWGLISLFRYQATSLRREVAELQERKETLETRNSQVWNTFKGVEPYHAEGKNDLLGPPKFTFSHVGTVGEREAWIIVRK